MFITIMHPVSILDRKINFQTFNVFLQCDVLQSQNPLSWGQKSLTSLHFNYYYTPTSVRYQGVKKILQSLINVISLYDNQPEFLIQENSQFHNFGRDLHVQYNYAPSQFSKHSGMEKNFKHATLMHFHFIIHITSPLCLKSKPRAHEFYNIDRSFHAKYQYTPSF